MSVEDGNHFIPENKDILAAFQVVDQWHFTIGKTKAEIMGKPLGKIAKAAGDYFTAGVAFLANRSSDKYLEDVGTATWHAINQKRVQTALTDNMIGAVIQMGVPSKIAREEFRGNDEAYVLFVGSTSGIIRGEKAVVLVPPELLIKAQLQPIEALATIAWISSHVCDLANERLYIDEENMRERAEATEAHFLINALIEHPDLILSTNSLKVKGSYPKGVDSLPASMRYKINTRPIGQG